MKFILIAATLIFSINLQAKTCTYEFDKDNSVVEGTGFKFTEKTGVTAKFKQFDLNKADKKSSAKELLDGLSVTVSLMSIDSGNALRDKNMRETLFANLIGDSQAVVEVTKVKAKEIETLLHLNDKKLPITFSYTMKKGMIEAQGSFDAINFAMNEAIASLKKRCKSLHTGKDGKSVTWSDFNLSVKAAVKKVCK